MFCPIFTKVNKVSLQFKQYAGLKRTYDTPELRKFVNFMHKNADTIATTHGIEAHTSKGSYIYCDFGGKYFCRTNLNTQTKQFWEIS